MSRLLIVVMMMLAWLALTNHCVLASIGARSAAKGLARCCQMGKHDVPKAPCQEAEQCCKAVKASLPAKAEVKFDASKIQVQIFAIVRVLTSETAQRLPGFVFDHGPPPAESFAESVLQRCLLSHAPPTAI
jgi:hypothetical protein